MRSCGALPPFLVGVSEPSARSTQAPTLRDHAETHRARAHPSYSQRSPFRGKDLEDKREKGTPESINCEIT